MRLNLILVALAVLATMVVPIAADEVDDLIEALKDEDSGVRYQAAEALGETGDARAVDPLIKALKDEDQLVREYAAEALGEIGDPRAIEPLTYMASNDAESWLRKKAARALEKIQAE